MIAMSRSDRLGTAALASLKALSAPSQNIIPAGAASGRPLYAVIAVMCYLASIALGLTLTVRQMASEYAKDLSGAITVQLKPSDAADPDQQMSRALEILNGTQGLYDIQALTSGDAEALVEPYIGRGNLPADVQIPQLVDVRIDPDARPDLDALAARLAANVPGAELNDHSRWKARLLAFSSSLQGVSVAALLLIVLAAVAIVIFATRAAMAANQQVVEVLHLIGAEDGFIASEFQDHFLRLGVVAGLTGAVCAAATLWLMGRVAGAEAEMFIPGLALGWTAYGSLILVPILSGVVAMITARLTALAVIGKVL